MITVAASTSETPSRCARAGERQFVVSCIFLIIATASTISWWPSTGSARATPPAHPLTSGLQVVQHQRPRIIANTDEAQDFRQILKTSPMRPTLYGLMFWRVMLGQVLTAAQARNTYGPIDLDILKELRARGRCCLHSPRRLYGYGPSCDCV